MYKNTNLYLRINSGNCENELEELEYLQIIVHHITFYQFETNSTIQQHTHVSVNNDIVFVFEHNTEMFT